jgi:uncharacterized protein (TIGR01777 family)
MAMKQFGVLITGASGMVGQALIQALRIRGYKLHAITSQSIPGVKCFPRPSESQPLTYASLESIDAIIHLSGASIAQGRWTEKRKKELLSSRVEILYQIKNCLLDHPEHTVKTLISTSATGIYGDLGEESIDENHPPGSGFLAQICKQWEAAAFDVGKSLSLRTVIYRLGVILTHKGGFLKTMKPMLYLPVQVLPKGGEPYMPWVGLRDVVKAYMWALEKNEFSGIFNLCAPQPLKMKELVKLSSRVKPLLQVSIPTSFLRVIMGEQANMLLESQKIPTSRLIEMGFNFENCPFDLEKL